MSAPVAGKFQDHYALLGVDPKANSEAIQAAYAKLAEKYRPQNAQTGDKEKFEAVNLAYEVLCDATLRAEFDKIKGMDQDDGKPTLFSVDFFDSLGKQFNQRAAIMSILYDRRQKKPYRPSLSVLNLDNMINMSPDDMSFALWYLKQRGLVRSDDKSNLQITADGMDFLEARQPAPESVLPFIKASAVAPSAKAAKAGQSGAPTKPAASSKPDQMAKPAPEAKPESEAADETESVLTVLSRALARR
jgi:hypothetical protein